MVSALFALALLAAANPDGFGSGAVGVIRAVRGEVNLGRGVELHGARSGELIENGMVIESDADGWAEIEVLGAGRVRISSSTHVAIAKTKTRFELSLETGRIWVEHAVRRGALLVTTPNARAVALSASSVVVEFVRTAGTTVAVRAGEAQLYSAVEDGPPQRIVRGQIADCPLGPGHVTKARPGGESLGEVVALEARANLGDLIGVKAFLLARVAGAKVKGFSARGVEELVRTFPEITGGDAGPAGALVEGGIRPPPFFENEVPPRGPNVHVKVTYGD